MASDKKIVTCSNDPNFAIICTFFHKFSKPLNLGHPNIKLLQEWLENSEEVSAGLKQLHIKLLRKLRKTVHETAWETALSKFCWFYSAQDAWEIERFGYKKASLRVKLRVLRELVESQFERNGKFRTVTQTMSADELRTEPIGRDKLGHSYWVAQDPDCNLRVFQEHLDEEIWQVVATNRDELVTLINRLRGNEVVLPSLVNAIDEDSSSNSCSGTVIKPPPPEERDESQDDDTITINNKSDKQNVVTDDNEEKMNEKIPNIKIKFDKIVENNDNNNVDTTNSVKIEEKEVGSDEEECYDEVEEEEEGEEEDDEEDITEGEEDDKADEIKTKKIEKNNTQKILKKDPHKKISSKNSENDKKVKPLIISQSKITSSTTSDDKSANNSITLSLSKKRPLADVEPDVKDNEDMSQVKKARPTLLDAKREKNISKYEKFKDDSEEDDDEEGDDDDDEEEEGEEEDGEEEGEEEGDDVEGEEEDTEEDEEIGEAIEEKVLIVKGSGSGKDCKTSFQDFLNESISLQLDRENIVGETIEEDVYYVCGDGWGAESLVGNPNKGNESKSPPKATFYFGQPGCLKLSPVKKKPSVAIEIVNENNDDARPSSVHSETVNDKNKGNNESSYNKEEILNNSIITNGENEIITETEVNTITTQRNNENHTNDKVKEIENNTTKSSENDKLHQTPIQSTSNIKPDIISEKTEKVENKILAETDHKSISQLEVSEKKNIAANQLPSKTSNELNETASPPVDNITIIPDILITDNESINLNRKSENTDEIEQQDNIELNSSKNLEMQRTNLPENLSVDEILQVHEEEENTIPSIPNCNTEKSVVEINDITENSNRICTENSQEIMNLRNRDETLKVLTKVDVVEESTSVVSSSEKCTNIALKSENLKEASPVNDSLTQAESLEAKIIPPYIENETCSEISGKSSQYSSTIEECGENSLKTESKQDFPCPGKISESSTYAETNSDIVNYATQNALEVIKIADSEEKSANCIISGSTPKQSALIEIVPQSPIMPKKLMSSSLSNAFNSAEVIKLQINPNPLITNRKRRLSPDNEHNASYLPPIDTQRRLSESSETDLNSENVDGECIEEDDENLGDDVGGKRARFRLKVVNTDLRKKIEAQRKIGNKDTGSSSSGEDERPRKKISPRKPLLKNQIEDACKIKEKAEDEIKAHTLQLESRKNRTSEKIHSGSVIKSSSVTTDDAKNVTGNKEVGEKPESLLIDQNTKAIKFPETSVSTKIFNKKISPNKLADKIEYLKQSKEKNMPSSTSCTAIQEIAATVSKEIVSPIKEEAMTINKRISPKKIEDKIEILKQNIEKTANLSGTLKTENIEIQDLGRARKRSSPPKKIEDIPKDIKSFELASLNLKDEISNKLRIGKLQHDSKGCESDEEIPRKRTISEESSDIKAIIVNLNENKKKSFEGHSSTDDDRSRKRTICENQSAEQITQQPVEKSSKTEELNDIQPENLEFNTKKREAVRKIAEDKMKLELRNSEDDDRPKKRTITRGGTDQCDEKRSEKLSKIEKANSICASTSIAEKKLLSKVFSKPHIAQEQIVPEDLSKKNCTEFPINKKKSLVISGTTEERVKMKFPQKDYIETSDKKLKLSSTAVSSEQTESPKENEIPQKLQSQATGDVHRSDSPEIANSKVIPLIIPSSAESEEERPRKRTINTDMSTPQDRPLYEIKKDKIEETQSMKSFVSPPEKLKIVERNEEKIKIVVKTCSVPDSTPTLPILFERIVSERASPEIGKSTAMLTIKTSPKKPIEAIKKCAPSVKKSCFEPVKLLEDPIDLVKKESLSTTPVKTRHTRRAGDAEPLLELTLAHTKRKSRQTISQTPKKATPVTPSEISAVAIGEDDKVEFVECKVEPKDEKLDEQYNEIKVEDNPLEKGILMQQKTNEKCTSNSKTVISSATSNDTPSKVTGRQQRRKREIDTSNIIDTESEVTPMRQSRRIAQLKIREEAERRKLEEIALKKMKEDLKRKKKEEKKQYTDDPTVVTEPSESDSDYKDDSDIELKKKFDKKKKGKRSGWSSGSNEEDDHDADDDDLFKYPASDHGSPLFKSDHEFSPESDIEDESQVVPLKRARTARKEGETVDEISGMTERDIDESCQKCGKSDHPEWILLCDKCDKGYHCSCLSPVLFIIPEGDWFCPPCQQEQLITALEKHLKEFDNLILSKKLEEEERIKTLELEAAETEKQKERDALEAAENELESKNEYKKKCSESCGKNRRRKATDNTCNENSKDSENDTESSYVTTDEESNSRKKRSERRNQRKKDRKNINRKKGSTKSSGSSSSNSEHDNSKSSATDSDDEPIYKLRKRRQTNISYRFNDYDELINRAIKKDENQGVIYSDDAGEDEEGAGNLGRGKDISTIIEADKEEKARQKQKDDEEKGIISENVKEKAKNLKTKTDDDSGSDFEPLKTKHKTLSNKKQRKKKNRKLNSLDISSEDDGSDEDFRTSSEDDDDDDESFSVSSGSDSSLEMYRRRSKKGRNYRKSSRRAARERKKIRDFVVEGSDDDSDAEEEKPKLKKKRKQVESEFSESDLDDDDEDELSEDLDSDEICDDDSTDSDQSGWRPSKRKKQKTAVAQKKKSSGKSSTTVNTVVSGKSPRQTIGKEIPKIVAAKKKPKRMDDDEKAFKAAGIVKKNRQRISDTGSSSSSSDGAGGRKTRGRRLFYMDDYDDEESSDGGIKPGVKRPDTPPEEREKFIKRQEEIKRMLAEKNVNKETKENSGKSVSLTGVSQSAKGTEKTGAGDSLSAVPLSVIRAAKALDVDYLQRKGEIEEEQSENEDDDETGAASAFGDDLPDDFNPDDMDEEAIAKMMEEEDFPQHQQMKVLPSPGDILKQQHKKLNTPPKVPPQPPTQQQTSVIQDPMMRKRLPMPTFHPLMRPSSGAGLSHLPLLQSALTNPVGMVQPPQQLIPGVPMSHHRPPQQHSLMQPTQTQIPLAVSKPRGRRKKITPLRDPVEKAAAVAAATTTTSTTTHQSSIPQNSSLPTNLSGKEAPPAAGISSLPTSAIQPPIPSGNLNVAQPPQLYKPPTNSPQPSVITRMPQMPPRQRFPDQGSRYYPPPGATGVSPNQLLPPHHRSPGSLRHSLMPPMHHQPPPPHHTLRPSYAGGPPPLRPGGPPLRPVGPPLRTSGPTLRPSGPPLRPGTSSPSLRHAVPSGPRGAPPSSSTTAINLGNGIGRDQTLARLQQPGPSQFSSEQFAGTHRSRHPTPPLNPYRPPLYGTPGYPPAPPPQHAVGSYPPGPPYGSYYPPPSLGPPTHSSTPSNSVIVAAAAAVSAAAASTVVVTPTRLAIPTSVVHHPPNQQAPPPRSSLGHSNLPPLPHRPTKVTTLETFDAKRTPPPLDLQQNPPSSLLHARENRNDDDDDDDVANPIAGTPSNSGASEFSGLVSYFSSQHDEF